MHVEVLRAVRGVHDRSAVQPGRHCLQRAEGVLDLAEQRWPLLWGVGRPTTRRARREQRCPGRSEIRFVLCGYTDRMHAQHHSLDRRLGVLFDQVLGHLSFA